MNCLELKYFLTNYNNNQFEVIFKIYDFLIYQFSNIKMIAFPQILIQRPFWYRYIWLLLNDIENKRNALLEKCIYNFD